MAFVLYCTNKGCGKSQEPLLDKASNQVFCSECGGVMNDVSSFTKTAMASIGQIKRQTSLVTKAFAMKCASCNRVEQPKLKNTKLVCSYCEVEHKGLSPIYAHSVKQFLTGAK